MQFLLILAIAFILYIIWKYWTLLIGAGYDPTPTKYVCRMLELAGISEDDIVYDLGSGDGRILIAAARVYGARAVGIEADPSRFIYSWLNILVSGQVKRARVKFGNLFKKNISDATIVTLFLFRPANEKLKDKLLRELKPGTRIVSYVWRFEEWEMQGYLPENRLYLYVIK